MRAVVMRLHVRVGFLTKMQNVEGERLIASNMESNHNYAGVAQW